MGVEKGGRGRIAVKCERSRKLENEKSQKHAKFFLPPFPPAANTFLRSATPKKRAEIRKNGKKRKKYEEAKSRGKGLATNERARTTPRSLAESHRRKISYSALQLFPEIDDSSNSLDESGRYCRCGGWITDGRRSHARGGTARLGRADCERRNDD